MILPIPQDPAEPEPIHDAPTESSDDSEHEKAPNVPVTYNKTKLNKLKLYSTSRRLSQL